MSVFYLLAVWLHLLAAATWVGGMLFFVLVLVPITRRAEYKGIAGELMQWLGERFRWLGWICFGLLIVTGIVNLSYRGVTWASLWDGRFWGGPFGQTLGMKLFLVALILGASAYHDFFLLVHKPPRPGKRRRLHRLHIGSAGKLAGWDG